MAQPCKNDTFKPWFQITARNQHLAGTSVAVVKAVGLKLDTLDVNVEYPNVFVSWSIFKHCGKLIKHDFHIPFWSFHKLKRLMSLDFHLLPNKTKWLSALICWSKLIYCVLLSGHFLGAMNFKCFPCLVTRSKSRWNTKRNYNFFRKWMC